MHLSINELTDMEQRKLREAIAYITKEADPVSILCYGLSRQQTRSTRCFAKSVLSTHCQLDLLVVCRDDQHVTEHDIAHAISDSQFECLVSICSEADMQRMLQEGNEFMTIVFREGAVLYHTGTRLPTRANTYPAREELLTMTKDLWHRWYNTASGFMDCASFCIAEANFGMAAFMIHQAIEHTCKAMLRVLMGFNLHTHNLAWIIKMCSRLSEDINPLFTRNTEHDKQLFNLLKSSYMDARYTADFKVTEQQAWVLFDKACALQRIACGLCHDKIRRLEGNGTTKEAVPSGQLLI